MTFKKHITTIATGHIYEKPGSTGYYRIYEVENSRYIDADKYVAWLEWSGTPEEINVDPAPTPEPEPQLPTLEDRMDALEGAFLDDLISRL